MNPWLLALLWTWWCAVHSLLITPAVVAHMRKCLDGAFRFYRLFYNLFALVTAAPLVYLGFSIRGVPVFSWQGPLRIVQLAMLLAAAALFLGGMRHYDGLQFFGLRQIRGADSCAALSDDCRLTTDGALSLVRHPWYAGGLLVLWARDIDTATLAVNLVLSAYLVIGAWLEERKLAIQFGTAYHEYRQRVSAFFPLKWIVRKIGHRSRR